MLNGYSFNFIHSMEIVKARRGFLFFYDKKVSLAANPCFMSAVPSLRCMFNRI